MTDNILPFPSRDDAGALATGAAVCLYCDHEWTATAPIPAPGTWLECPVCGAEKALLRYPCRPAENAALWQCRCGNELFYVTQTGVMCPNCGQSQRF